MDFLQYTAGIDDDGRRLDRVIRIFLNEVPMSEIYKLIRKGLIRLNGKKTECSTRIKKDDVLQIAKSIAAAPLISVQPDSDSGAIAENIHFDDVFKNEHIRIINKPYGVSVHGGGNSRAVSLEQIVKQQFAREQAEKQDKDNKSLSFRPGPLHRIDRHTTGLVVFSQSLGGAKVFSRMLQSHVIKKEYLAVLCGNLSGIETWEDIISDATDKADVIIEKKSTFHTVRVCDENEKQNGKKARSKATPVAHGVYDGIEITLALIEIETGRKHQIRSQCAYHGHPLLGDTAYGGKNPSGIDGHFLLHAWRMIFHADNELCLPEVITAPLPTNFQFFIKNHLSLHEISNYNILSI